MEKGKGGGRGPKGKTMQFPGDFIALGSKSGRQDSGEGKRANVHQKGSSTLALDRKRDGPSASGTTTSSGIPAKKSKLMISVLTPLGRSQDSGKSGDAKEEAWESVAVDISPEDILSAVADADDTEDCDRIDGVLCGAVKQLRLQRGKPDQVLFLSMMYLAKTQPLYFCTEYVVEALCSLLKRDMSLSFKTKGNVLVPVLAANILMAAYLEEKSWPEIFVKVYIEDAVGERLWVDHEDCKGFVDNICTAFCTRMPPKSLICPELSLGGRSELCPSPPIGASSSGDVEVLDIQSSDATETREKPNIAVEMRYAGMQDEIEKMVMDVVKEQLSRRQHTENITRNFLRLLSATCGLSEVRATVVQRLEIWLQNPKITRPAQELLMSLCMNCDSHLQSDVEIVSQLVKIRLKTKPLVQLYLSCIRELISVHSDNLAAVLKHTIYNELSVARNQNNMAMLGVMFSHSPDIAAATLADVCMELLMRKEDFLWALRALLREIVRALRYDINLKAFCSALTRERNDAQFHEFENKERMFLAISDLITLCIFLAISPGVKEAGSLAARGDKKDIGILQTYQKLVANIQQEAVHWIHSVVIRMYHPGKREFSHCLHKVLFREQSEHYFGKDPWPPENERQLMWRLASEVPVLQSTLVQIFVIGLSKNHPLLPPDALELADQLIKRAAALYTEGFPVLQADKMDIIDLIFNLCTYHHPENITLPAGYQPPKLAITNLYWKAWIMLLILAAHNPSTFGSVAWENYSTLRAFMEMCITNHFNFPPPTMASREQVEELRNKELQLASIEKQEILGFEGHLAAASTQLTITEQTSLLLSQLTTMDPVGIARKPPAAILEQLKALNASLKLGHLLCRSRNPDFLLDIIQRQGTSQSMPWLADLVESSEGSFSLLPVQCLCEFLMHENMQASLESEEAILITVTSNKGITSDKNQRQQEKQRKLQQLLIHLQTMLQDPAQDPQTCADILDYFFRRLSSEQMNSRVQAVRGLKMVLSPLQPQTTDEDVMETDLLDTSMEGEATPSSSMSSPHINHPHAWLLRHLPALPHFHNLCGQVTHSLRNACQVEHDPGAVGAYIQFLARHAVNDPIQDLSDLVLDMAQLIVERSTLISAILPSESNYEANSVETLQAFLHIFVLYMQKAREPSREAIYWSENQDQIRVHWSTGEEATMHILVVHAMVILLTYGAIQDPTLFMQLLEMWFPTHQDPPKAFLVDTSEEALLFYDWLKLRMIRSKVKVLVDAALRDLEPAQLVLFIQSFGIPVSSMSQLLQTLDQAVETNHMAVSEAVMDKTYMAQLVEVQWKRGARGGEKFVELLQLKESRPAAGEKSPSVVCMKQEPVEVHPRASEKFTADQVAKILACLFDCETKMKTQLNNKHALYRSLQKALHQEIASRKSDCPILRSSIDTLDFLLQSQHRAFIKSMIEQPNFSCVLLRLLITGCETREMQNSSQKQRLLKLSAAILTFPGISESPVCNMLKKFCKLSGGKKHLTEPVRQTTADTVQELEKTSLLRLELRGWKVMEEGMKKNESNNLVEAVTRVILSEVNRQDKPKEALTHAGLASKTGLFIDWLEILDSEMIESCPKIQMNLLFSRQAFGKLLCRPYLLSLLTHRASWTALNKCVDSLLEDCNKEFDPTSVLDVVSNCTTNQKLWQGRDKYIPKHRQPEDVLKLDQKQLLALVEYVLEEAILLDKSDGRKSALEALESRVRLVLCCCNEKLQFLEELVKHLTGFWKQREGPLSAMSVQLLLQLYLQIPRIISHIPEVEEFLREAHSTSSSSCFLDTMLHAVLSFLTTTQPGKEWAHKMREIDMVARKMAAQHPVLFLRQLPLLAASLHGRVHLDYGIFRSRNHLNLFNHMMGILELLQPYLYSPEHGPALEETLTSYFELYKNYTFVKDLAHLLARFVSLLQTFMSHDPTRALSLMRRYGYVLNCLLGLYPDMPMLRALVSGVMMPKIESEGRDAEGQRTPLIPIPSSILPQPNWSQEQVMPLYLKMNRSDFPDDIMGSLQDLENISKLRPEVLVPFSNVIKKLVSHWNETVRAFAFSMLLRHIRHSPSLAHEFVGTYLACLDSEKPDVVEIAVEKLPEFSILAQEQASVLLQKAFTLGVNSSINTGPHIIRALMLLHMQNGY